LRTDFWTRLFKSTVFPLVSPLDPALPVRVAPAVPETFTALSSPSCPAFDVDFYPRETASNERLSQPPPPSRWSKSRLLVFPSLSPLLPVPRAPPSVCWLPQSAPSSPNRLFFLAGESTASLELTVFQVTLPQVLPLTTRSLPTPPGIQTRATPGHLRGSLLHRQTSSWLLCSSLPH